MRRPGLVTYGFEDIPAPLGQRGPGSGHRNLNVAAGAALNLPFLHSRGGEKGQWGEEGYSTIFWVLCVRVWCTL